MGSADKYKKEVDQILDTLFKAAPFQINPIPPEQQQQIKKEVLDRFSWRFNEQIRNKDATMTIADLERNGREHFFKLISQSITDYFGATKAELLEKGDQISAAKLFGREYNLQAALFNVQQEHSKESELRNTTEANDGQNRPPETEIPSFKGGKK